MFIPYKVDVPMQRWPVANLVLMGLTILISLAMFGPLGNWAEQRAPDRALPPEVAAELQKLGLDQNASVPERSIVDDFLLQPGNFRVTQLLGNLFIHAGFLHLAGNMLFLFVFGNAVNAKLGHVYYVVLYLGAGVLESIVWMVAGPRAPSLGASGAIMGVVGAFLLLYPLNDVSVAYLFSLFYRGVMEISAMWVIAAYVAFDVWGLIRGGNSGVAYLSHVVGFVSGASMGAALLWWKWVEMERGECSLLQVWGWMPAPEEAPGRPSAGSMPEYASRPLQPRRPLPVPKREEGPLPLD